MILQVRHVSVVLVLLFYLSQRDMLRLGVDEMLDRFSPGVKHDCYKVGNLSVCVCFSFDSDVPLDKIIPTASCFFVYLILK